MSLPEAATAALSQWNKNSSSILTSLRNLPQPTKEQVVDVFNEEDTTNLFYAYLQPPLRLLGAGDDDPNHPWGLDPGSPGMAAGAHQHEDREKDIVADHGTHWVHHDKKKNQYTVYSTGVTHSTSDSSYPATPDGLSIATARSKYLAGRSGGMDAHLKKYRKEAIENPNSSKQGHDEDHKLNPHHATILKHGYAYSHSTPVIHGDTTVIHHTYKHTTLKPLGDHNVSVHKSPRFGHHIWSTSKGGSGHRFSGQGDAALDKHLKGHVARAKRAQSYMGDADHLSTFRKEDFDESASHTQTLQAHGWKQNTSGVTPSGVRVMSDADVADMPPSFTHPNHPGHVIKTYADKSWNHTGGSVRTGGSTATGLAAHLQNFHGTKESFYISTLPESQVYKHRLVLESLCPAMSEAEFATFQENPKGYFTGHGWAYITDTPNGTMFRHPRFHGNDIIINSKSGQWEHISRGNRVATGQSFDDFRKYAAPRFQMRMESAPKITLKQFEDFKFPTIELLNEGVLPDAPVIHVLARYGYKPERSTRAAQVYSKGESRLHVFNSGAGGWLHNRGGQIKHGAGAEQLQAHMSKIKESVEPVDEAEGVFSLIARSHGYKRTQAPSPHGSGKFRGEKYANWVHPSGYKLHHHGENWHHFAPGHDDPKNLSVPGRAHLAGPLAIGKGTDSLRAYLHKVHGKSEAFVEDTDHVTYHGTFKQHGWGENSRNSKGKVHGVYTNDKHDGHRITVRNGGTYWRHDGPGRDMYASGKDAASMRSHLATFHGKKESVDEGSGRDYENQRIRDTAYAHGWYPKSGQGPNGSELQHNHPNLKGHTIRLYPTGAWHHEGGTNNVRYGQGKGQMSIEKHLKHVGNYTESDHKRENTNEGWVHAKDCPCRGTQRELREDWQFTRPIQYKPAQTDIFKPIVPTRPGLENVETAYGSVLSQLTVLISTVPSQSEAATLKRLYTELAEVQRAIADMRSMRGNGGDQSEGGEPFMAILASVRAAVGDGDDIGTPDDMWGSTSRKMMVLPAGESLRARADRVVELMTNNPQYQGWPTIDRTDKPTPKVLGNEEPALGEPILTGFTDEDFIDADEATVSHKKYKCRNCGHEKSISTNHEGSVIDHCPNCSWKPSFRGDPENYKKKNDGLSVPFGGRTYRPFDHVKEDVTELDTNNPDYQNWDDIDDTDKPDGAKVVGDDATELGAAILTGFENRKQWNKDLTIHIEVREGGFAGISPFTGKNLTGVLPTQEQALSRLRKLVSIMDRSRKPTEAADPVTRRLLHQSSAEGPAVTNESTVQQYHGILTKHGYKQHHYSGPEAVYTHRNGHSINVDSKYDEWQHHSGGRVRNTGVGHMLLDTHLSHWHKTHEDSGVVANPVPTSPADDEEDHEIPPPPPPTPPGPPPPMVAGVAHEHTYEMAPPGFSGVVRKMKEKGMATEKAFALAWSMYKKGHKAHVAPEGFVRKNHGMQCNECKFRTYSTQEADKHRRTAHLGLQESIKQADLDFLKSFDHNFEGMGPQLFLLPIAKVHGYEPLALATSVGENIRYSFVKHSTRPKDYLQLELRRADEAKQFGTVAGWVRYSNGFANATRGRSIEELNAHLLESESGFKPFVAVGASKPTPEHQQPPKTAPIGPVGPPGPHPQPKPRPAHEDTMGMMFNPVDSDPDATEIPQDDDRTDSDESLDEMSPYRFTNHTEILSHHGFKKITPGGIANPIKTDNSVYKNKEKHFVVVNPHNGTWAHHAGDRKVYGSKLPNLDTHMARHYGNAKFVESIDESVKDIKTLHDQMTMAHLASDHRKYATLHAQAKQLIQSDPRARTYAQKHMLDLPHPKNVKEAAQPNMWGLKNPDAKKKHKLFAILAALHGNSGKYALEAAKHLSYAVGARSTQETRDEFAKELETLINKHSMENHSNTPDFLVAKHLMNCLDSFNAGVNDREKWYGRNNAGPASATSEEVTTKRYKDFQFNGNYHVHVNGKRHPHAIYRDPSNGYWHENRPPKDAFDQTIIGFSRKEALAHIAKQHGVAHEAVTFSAPVGGTAFTSRELQQQMDADDDQEGDTERHLHFRRGHAAHKKHLHWTFNDTDEARHPDLDKPARSLAHLNKHLPHPLVKGEGYYYFPDSHANEQGVYGVGHHTHMTIRQWQHEHDKKFESMNEATEYKGGYKGIVRELPEPPNSRPNHNGDMWLGRIPLVHGYRQHTQANEAGAPLKFTHQTTDHVLTISRSMSDEGAREGRGWKIEHRGRTLYNGRGAAEMHSALRKIHTPHTKEARDLIIPAKQHVDREKRLADRMRERKLRRVVGSKSTTESMDDFIEWTNQIEETLIGEDHAPEDPAAARAHLEKHGWHEVPGTRSSPQHSSFHVHDDPKYAEHHFKVHPNGSWEHHKGSADGGGKIHNFKLKGKGHSSAQLHNYLSGGTKKAEPAAPHKIPTEPPPANPHARFGPDGKPYVHVPRPQLQPKKKFEPPPGFKGHTIPDPKKEPPKAHIPAPGPARPPASPAAPPKRPPAKPEPGINSRGLDKYGDGPIARRLRAKLGMQRGKREDANDALAADPDEDDPGTGSGSPSIDQINKNMRDGTADAIQGKTDTVEPDEPLKPGKVFPKHRNAD